jgi:hypothetical protein
VHIAGTQGAPLQVAKLVEHEQRVQALRLEVTVPHCSLLIAVNRTLRTVHVEGNGLRRAPVMHGVDPTARQVRQGIEVLVRRQHSRLKPTHGACRGRTMLHRPPANELPHHRITAEPISIIDVFISSQARENGLAQKAREAVAAILSRARITDQTRRHIRQAKGVIQFAMKKQSTVRTDRRPTKCQFDRTVKSKPKRAGFRFTRRIPRQIPTSSKLSY